MGHPNDRAALEAGSFVWALELDPHLWDVGQGNLNFSSVYLSVTVLAAVIAYVLILSTTTTKWEPSAAGRYPGLPSACDALKVLFGGTGEVWTPPLIWQACTDRVLRKDCRRGGNYFLFLHIVFH